MIADAVLATAPDARAAQVLQQALGTVPLASVTDTDLLCGKLDVVELLGPATLSYLGPADFRPQHAPSVELLDARDPALRQFLSETDAGDLGESGIQGITSPAFAIRERNQIVAAAGYRRWPGRVAHLSVLTAAHARGRGLACAVASAAVSNALGEDRLPQWRARPEVSQQIARRLGFRELGTQISIRLRNRSPRVEGDGNSYDPLGRSVTGKRHEQKLRMRW